MIWPLAATMNAVIAVAYFAICATILRGLVGTGQLRSNRLAVATAAIFFTCAVHHGAHTVHMLLPAFGVDGAHGLSLRQAFGWQAAAWDLVGATVAVYYLSLRRTYATLLQTPAMFDDEVRRRTSEQVERERTLLTQAEELAGAGSWEHDLRAGSLIWSPGMHRIAGREPDARTPTMHSAALEIHADDRERVAVELAPANAIDDELSSSYRVVWDDGTVRQVEARGRVQRDSEGVAVRIVGATLDVTERNAAETLRLAAEEQFRRSFDHALTGMMTFDLEGRYIEVNDAFCAIVGHPRETLVGLSRERITHPDDLAPDRESLRALIAGETSSYTRTKRYIHASGHVVWASIGATLVHDSDGQPLHFIAQAQDITERRRYETQLKHMAEHDPLTGLLNRRSFERELNSHVARVKRSGASGAVLMLDLDNFKYFNDTQGHGAGDKLIVRVAQRLALSLRETDVVARLGGDEFAILLSSDGAQGAEIVAEKLIADIREQAPATVLSGRRPITASAGIACFVDGERLTPEEIMVNADLAMYEAKENGRNRVAHYSTDQHSRPRIESQMKWATEITEALAKDRFELLAQPIEPLRASGPTQFELLLRMRDSNDNMIPPGTFLYIAERLGLIQEIDHWVVSRAIDMLAEHRAAGRDLRLEVNLSGLTIGDPGLLDLIESGLHETGVPPDRLVFEVTETAAIANIARAAAFAERLSDLGCKFALDDFGAGFGSFYYLKHLPFDYLKIDGEFVRHCATNETDRILVSSVVQIARGMGKQTIAEFVEDQETVEVLTRLGVDYGQGFHLGRPAPLGEHLATIAVVT